MGNLIAAYRCPRQLPAYAALQIHLLLACLKEARPPALALSFVESPCVDLYLNDLRSPWELWPAELAKEEPYGLVAFRLHRLADCGMFPVACSRSRVLACLSRALARSRVPVA